MSSPTRRFAARAIVLALVALPLSYVSLTSPAQADGPGTGSPWIVSVGDSYISGEAGRWAGNTNNGEVYHDALGSTAYFDNAGHTAETINRCHRSSAAEVYTGVVNGMNLACSGAKTSTFTDSNGYSKPGLASPPGGRPPFLQSSAGSHNVKAVAV